jgi:hypothetical protein
VIADYIILMRGTLQQLFFKMVTNSKDKNIIILRLPIDTGKMLVHRQVRRD